MPGEWLYLNKEELSLRKIYELFEEKQTAEYWEAAGVLEISLPESGTLDMEDLEGTLGDEEGDAYLKENEIHKLDFSKLIQASAHDILLYLKHTIMGRYELHHISNQFGFQTEITK